MRAQKPFQFTSILEESRNKLWGCHFGVPNRIAEKLIDDTSRRVTCTINTSAEYQCAMLPRGDGSFVITVNKKIRDTLGLAIGMSVDITLRKDESEYGLPMPEEMKEVLKQDRDGDRLFHSLTPGKRRTLIYIAGFVKNTDVRIKRALTIIDHLKKNGGKINYKKLSESLKALKMTAPERNKR